MNSKEIDGKLRRILADYARAVEEQCHENDRPLRRSLYEMLLRNAETRQAKNNEHQIFMYLGFLAGFTFMLIIVLKILEVL